MQKHNGRLLRAEAAAEFTEADDVADPEFPEAAHGPEAERREAEREFLARNGPVMDEEDAVRRAYREAALRELAHRKGVFASIYGFQGNPKFALDCAVAAHGFFEILGARDFTQLAEKWGCTKANVVKLVKQIQRENGMPPAPNQREETGCATMRQVRNGQMKR